MRNILIAVALAMIAPVASAQSITLSQTLTPLPAQTLDTPSPLERLNGLSPQVIDAACCRVCRTGKACGNSCINRNYNCHQPQGCACNG